jgi:hypothetical protein
LAVAPDGSSAETDRVSRLDQDWIDSSSLSADLNSSPLSNLFGEPVAVNEVQIPVLSNRNG